MPGDPSFTASSTLGVSTPRRESKRLLAGGGRFTGDIVLPRSLHAAFVRSPYAHASITAIDTAEAAALPGVLAVYRGVDLAAHCKPMEMRLAHLPQHRSAAQPALASTKAVWQGQPVAAVVASSRAVAEDAAALVRIDWQPLPTVADAGQAVADAPIIHQELDSNTAFELTLGEWLESADNSISVERVFQFGRQTGVPLESRAIIASYDRAADSLTVYQSQQAPHLMQALFAHHLSIPEHRVRVVCPDVGGAFGIKMHFYADELATVAMAKMLGRAVRFDADRLESFVSDAHAREFTATAGLNLDAKGAMDSLTVTLDGALGAYSIYPRSSIGDGRQGVSMCAAPYRLKSLAGQLALRYQNKVPTGAYRGVGQPIACAITELLVDDAAHAAGIDPVDFRRQHYHRPDELPATTPGGLLLGQLSLEQCLDRLCEMMSYGELRGEQRRLREGGIYRGIGVASFVEQTAVGAGLYGPSGMPISAQDTCSVRLEPSATVRCEVGCTDQGQGTLTGIAQIVAATLDVAVDDVTVTGGDSAGAHGGGAWASRGLAVGGEAALKAARAVRQHVLQIAAAVLQTDAATLRLQGGAIVDADGRQRLNLIEVCELAYFRQHQLPPGVDTQLTASHSFVPRDPPYFTANGIQGSYLEVDTETGLVRLLKHWVVEDCGHVVNPRLVEEQIRGGVVQGLGAALFECCEYDTEGQLLNGSLADYLVPMAAEMPDIEVAHAVTAQTGTELGVKGAGEAGIIGATAAAWCALNDAIRPLGTTVSRQPFTPEVVLNALAETTTGTAWRSPT